MIFESALRAISQMPRSRSSTAAIARAASALEQGGSLPPKNAVYERPEAWGEPVRLNTEREDE